MKPNVFPIREVGSGADFRIQTDLPTIIRAVGQPNVTDLEKDTEKIRASWAFQDGLGRTGFIWSFKADPATCQIWSADGNPDLLGDLFPGKVTPITRNQTT